MFINTQKTPLPSLPASTRILLILTSVSVLLTSALRHPDGFSYKECLPEQAVCEYWLIINEELTMIFHGDLVYADKGRLYLYNEHPSNFTTLVSVL